MNDNDTTNDELRAEYDEAFLKKGVRGKYADRYAAASNVVKLAPDLARIFPNEESVNEALRIVVRVTSETSRLSKQCTADVTNSRAEDVGQFFNDSDLLGTG